MEFEVKEEEALVYGSVIDYSQGILGSKEDQQMGQGIGVRIRESGQGVVVVESRPDKYFNYIPSTTLQKGKYWLEIFHSSLSPSRLFRFSLNFLLEREDTTTGYSMQLLEHSVQLCTPSPPLRLPRSLTAPHLLHALSGAATLSAHLDVGACDILTTGSFIVSLPNHNHDHPQRYLLSVYLEGVSKFEVRVHEGVQMTRETAVVVGRYSEVNKVNENFIKQNRVRARNIVQVRVEIEAGKVYRIVTEGVEGDAETLKNIGRCDNMKMVIDIAPVREKAKECPQVGVLEK